MANNLHISYDLHVPGQNYQAVADRIKQLGNSAKLHFSFWHVKSTFTATEAVNYIKPVLDPNDLVYVVDATNNTASWNALPQDATDHIAREWLR